MSDERGLLAAIAENPEDDGLRLVFADWLEENGDPERAEFIRSEVDRARNDPWADSNPLTGRAAELWQANSDRWFPGLRSWAEEIETHRGFPYRVALPVRAFVVHGKNIFAVAPTVRAVVLDGLGKNMPALAACPALAHVRELIFFETPIGSPEIGRFVASPHLARLRSLDLSNTESQIGPRGAIALARATQLSLEELDLFGHAIGDRGAVALVSATQFRDLRHLALGNNGLSSPTGHALARAAHLTRLEHLNLMWNRLEPDGVAALASAPHLTNLRTLNLGGSLPGTEGVAALAHLTRLEDLSLAHGQLTDPEVATLFRLPNLATLTTLGLYGGDIGEEAIAALTAARHLKRLASLDLRSCGINADLAGRLGEVESLPALRTLQLARNPLGPTGISRLLAGPLVAELTLLDLERCELGDNGARAVATSTSFQGRLTLDENEITDAGARLLAESGLPERLRSLSLNHNPITDAGKAVLRAAFGERVRLG